MPKEIKRPTTQWGTSKKLPVCPSALIAAGGIPELVPTIGPYKNKHLILRSPTFVYDEDPGSSINTYEATRRRSGEL